MVGSSVAAGLRAKAGAVGRALGLVDSQVSASAIREGVDVMTRDRSFRNFFELDWKWRVEFLMAAYNWVVVDETCPACGKRSRLRCQTHVASDYSGDASGRFHDREYHLG